VGEIRIFGVQQVDYFEICSLRHLVDDSLQGLCHCGLVLATVPGYPAAVRIWNRTGWSSPGCYQENMGTRRVRGRVGTGPRFHIMVPATLAPIKFLGSDRIKT